MVPPDDEQTRPGPVYDRALRRLVAADPVAFCRALGVPVEPQDGAVPVLATRFAPGVLDADLLLVAGPGRLLHVEYQRRAGPGLALRMLAYRSAIMTAHPGQALEQVVLVLGDGLPDSVDAPGEGGFRLGCRVVQLRDVDPEHLLGSPVTAPLAVLGRGSAETRARAFLAALRMAAAQPAGLAGDLVDVACVLATIRLDRPMIDKIREEAGMTVESVADFWADTDVGRFVQQRARAEGVEQGLERGLEQGLERGIEQGLERGREEALSALLRLRFGDAEGIGPLAHRLATSEDFDGVVRAVTTASTLAELVADGGPAPAAD